VSQHTLKSIRIKDGQVLWQMGANNEDFARFSMIFLFNFILKTAAFQFNLSLNPGFQPWFFTVRALPEAF
jgi:hypothetical protein